VDWNSNNVIGFLGHLLWIRARGIYGSFYTIAVGISSIFDLFYSIGKILLMSILKQKEKLYDQIFEMPPEQTRLAARELILKDRDLYFFLSRICGRRDLNHPWLHDRCVEVASQPDGYLDLWARDHRKSTIITFGMTLLDLCANSELIFGIFSYNNKTATQFVQQIKAECETNVLLPWLFPEVFWENPKRDAPSWSLEKGITLKRKSNPKESTVSGWGLVDNMPTGWHFTHMVYDDVVTKDSVTNPEMVQKTTQAWELSTNLESTRDGEAAVVRMIGTRYAFGDTWQEILNRKAAIPRLYPCIENGQSVFLPMDIIEKKKRTMNNTFYSQMLLDPRADSPKGFSRANIQYYDDIAVKSMNLYITVDPASSKKKGSDWTVMCVHGLAEPDNYFLVDAIRDRLSLPERIKALMDLHRKWHRKSKILRVGYEKYGMQADIEAIKMVQERDSYFFAIEELGGQIKKEDRIDWLMPIFEEKRLYLPRSLNKTLYDKSTLDLIEYLIEFELMRYPVSEHDDFMDCMARILDPDFKTKFPNKAGSSAKIKYPKLANIA